MGLVEVAVPAVNMETSYNIYMQVCSAGKLMSSTTYQMKKLT